MPVPFRILGPIKSGRHQRFSSFNPCIRKTFMRRDMEPRTKLIECQWQCNWRRFHFYQDPDLAVHSVVARMQRIITVINNPSLNHARFMPVAASLQSDYGTRYRFQVHHEPVSSTRDNGLSGTASPRRSHIKAHQTQSRSRSQPVLHSFVAAVFSLVRARQQFDARGPCMMMEPLTRAESSVANSTSHLTCVHVCAA